MCPDPFSFVDYKEIGTHGMKAAVVNGLVAVIDKDGNHHVFSRDAAFELMEFLFPFRPVPSEVPQEERGFGQL